MPVTQRGGGLDFVSTRPTMAVPPTLPHADRTLDIACKMAQDFVIACSHNDPTLSTITPQSRREAYRELIAQFYRPRRCWKGPVSSRAGLEELSHSGQVFDPWSVARWIPRNNDLAQCSASKRSQGVEKWRFESYEEA